MSLREKYEDQGHVLLRNFFDVADVRRIRDEAKSVFVSQMKRTGIVSHAPQSEAEFSAAMVKLFEADFTAFANCGKQCQHLVSLHRFALADKLIDQVRAFGVETPNISTRPVLYFNMRKLAKHEVYYKTPAHQDWLSMQGSLNAIIVWVPMVDVPRELGALEIIPRSHVAGLLRGGNDETELAAGFRRLSGIDESAFEPVEVKAGDALFFSSFLIHRSGDNITDGIRWSFHLRYNDLSEPTFIERKYPNPYIYRPTHEPVTPNFPSVEQLEHAFGRGRSRVT